MKRTEIVTDRRSGDEASRPPIVERLQRRIAELEERCELLGNEAEALHAELEACAREMASLRRTIDEANERVTANPVPRGEEPPPPAAERARAERAPWWSRLAQQLRGTRS